MKNYTCSFLGNIVRDLNADLDTPARKSSGLNLQCVLTIPKTMSHSKTTKYEIIVELTSPIHKKTSYRKTSLMISNGTPLLRFI